MPFAGPRVEGAGCGAAGEIVRDRGSEDGSEEGDDEREDGEEDGGDVELGYFAWLMGRISILL